MIKKKHKVGVILLPFVLLLGICGIFIVIVYSTIYTPAMKLKAQLEPFKASITQLKEVAKENNIESLQNQYNMVKKEYSYIQDKAKALYWLKNIPFANSYAKDLDNGLTAGQYLLEAGDSAISAIAPYADLIGFKKGGPAFNEQSTENRLQTAVLTLDKVLVNVDVIAEKLSKAETLVASIDENKYPEKLNGIELRSTIANSKEQFAGITKLFVDAKPFLKNLPTILGKDKEMKYLVLFQNDKELRATGGFLTAYAEFAINKGKINLKRSTNIYDLDATLKNPPPATRELLTYHINVNKLYLRDSNLSPDVPTSVGIFESLLEKTSYKTDYDGIVFVDTNLLVDMLKTFGETEVNGVRFNAEPDKRCGGCPQVIYTLSDLIGRPVGYIKTDRKGILGDLVLALFQKALGFSPSKYWGPFSQQLMSNLQQKHILLYFKDANLEESAKTINFAGTIAKADGNDYLYVNNVNFGGQKSNLFVTENITSKTEKKDGNIKRTVTVEYKNPQPPSDCNLERGGLCLNAPLRTWVRFYVPKGSKFLEVKGNKKDVKTYDEFDKTVIETFTIVDPLGKIELSISYSLPSGVNESVLNVQKQPGTYSQGFKTFMNGKKVFDGPLDMDTTMVIK